MISLRRLYSPKFVKKIIRNYASSVKIDPGINRRKKIVDATEDVEDIEYDDYETDFMNLHKTHKEHVDAMKAMKEKEKYLIVRQKYFKEKYPNFLTWHDKEQIRYLYSKDPEEWTIDRISEGFPALPEVILKIVKSNWTKKNQAKITNHDKTVQKNWEEFKAEKFKNLPNELVEHLKKFTSRSLNLKPFEIPKEAKNIAKPNEKVGEFSEIIVSYEQLKNKKKMDKLEADSNKKIVVPENTENKKIKSSKNKNLVTFTELQNKVEEKAKKGWDLSEEDKLLLRNSSKDDHHMEQIGINKEDLTDIGQNKYENKVGFVRKTARDYSHLIYPEKITIPKNIHKKGGTYKLNDCYYDSDGEFLYRVPGMG